MESNFYQIAVDCPVGDSLFTYTSQESLNPGDLVQVPFGKRKVNGTVWKKESESELEKIKQVERRLETELRISDSQRELYSWMANYYHYPVGKLIFDIFPKILKRPRQVPVIRGNGDLKSFDLTAEQAPVVEKLKQKLGQGFSQSLVHGITGSGKSIVFYELLREEILKGNSVLYLLPEINLTPQFFKFFSEHLDCEIYVYHSELNNSEKYTLWTKVAASDNPKLILSVRSGVFLPLKKLGLIIVDEEHDGSFKQEDRCPYNARDIAIKRASLDKIPVVLGSATPTIESYYRFTKQIPENYFPLRTRAGEASLPEIQFIDLTEDSEDKDNWPFRPLEIEAIKERVDKGEQVLIFLNRLGYSSFVQCRSCGHRFECPNCSVGLKYFKRKNLLSCQHCTLKYPLPLSCPECQCLSLVQKGFGTEKVLEKLKELIPGVRAERLDRDEIKNFKQLEERLDDFHQHKFDVLIGTQMISKGHNFKNVNLVLVMGIDSQLNFPDFRSSEKVYQQLSQISGRSGRFSDSGKVMVQSLNGFGHHFDSIKDHSFDDFYKDELEIREVCDCPPFSKLAVIYLSCHDLGKLESFSEQAKKVLNQLAQTHFPEVTVLGPRSNAVEKRVNQWT